MINKINEEIKNCIVTIFDDFDLSIDLRKSGNGLKEDIITLSNLYGRINKLSSHANFLYNEAKNKRDTVESLAWEKVPKDSKITMQKVLVKNIAVEIDGEKTTLNDEEHKVNLYSYFANRGKDKVKEISAMIDLGRSLLSWDKTERSSCQYS